MPVPLCLCRHFQAGLRLDPEQAEHRKEFKKLKSLDKKTKEVRPRGPGITLCWGTPLAQTPGTQLAQIPGTLLQGTCGA